MYDLILDYLTFFLIATVILFGWAIAVYYWRKRENLIGAVVFFVWLAVVTRSLLVFVILRYIFGESAMNKIMSGISGRFLIGVSDVITSLMVLFVLVLIVYIPYAFLKKQFRHALIASLLIFLAHFSYLESYFVFYPLIDTEKSSLFTLKRFDMIKPGMTKNQVRMLIGDPIEGAGQYHAPCEGQTGDNAAALFYDFAWLNSSVCYDESDQVIETKKMWVPD